MVRSAPRRIVEVFQGFLYFLVFIPPVLVASFSRSGLVINGGLVIDGWSPVAVITRTSCKEV